MSARDKLLSRFGGHMSESVGATEVGGFPGVPLIQGGRSNGARVAGRTARQAGALAVLALAFPLHPPCRP